MPRDINVLSEKDLFEKTKSIVEYVRDSNINLQYKYKLQNWCKKTGLYEYTVNVSSPPVKYIPKYTALLHELGHILYKTPFYQIDKLLRQQAFAGNSDYYFMIYNILEDERMESHLTKGYLAYKKRFNSCLKKLGENNLKGHAYDTTSDYDDPAIILFAVRTMQNKLVKDQKHYDVFKKAIEDVKLTDRFGSLKILISIKPYIDEWLNNRSTIDKRFSPESVKSKTEKRHISPLQDEIDAVEDPIPNEIEELVDKLNEGIKQSEKELEDMIEDSKEQGDIEHQEVEELIVSQAQKFDRTPAQVFKLNRSTVLPIINKRISNKLNRIFKKLQMGNKIFTDYQGFEINTDEFIANSIKGSNLAKSFSSMKSSDGGAILISVDGSTSMNKLMDHKQTRMTIARNLVATLYDSLRSINNIELKGNVWSSSPKGRIGITEINSIRDVKMINIHKDYNATPTHMALDYSIETLKRMRGKNKLLIIITDGSPNYHQMVDGEAKRLHPNTYFPIVKKSFDNAMKLTPNIVFVVITPFWWIGTRMEHMFGKDRVITVDQAQGVNEKVIKRFKEVVMKTIV